MNEMELIQHRLYAQFPSFARKLDWTKHIIDDALSKGVSWYAAFSGGIDSTILLDILFQMGINLDVLWGDDGIDYPETLQFLTETERHYDFHLRRIRCTNPWRDWCMEMMRPDLCDDPDALTAWLNPHVWNATWHTLTKEAHKEYGGVFMGMLASESRSRGFILHNGYRPLYQVKGEAGIWHCSPLAHWEKRDVWAYVCSYDLPYNTVYNVLADMGVPIKQRRVAALTCFRVIQYGSVTTFRQGWPELYNNVSALFPAIRQYA